MSDIHYDHFFGCMPCGIFIFPWMVRCTIRFIDVVTIMFYLLDYFGLLLLSVVGIAVCICNQILQMYVCNLICGDELLIT